MAENISIKSDDIALVARGQAIVEARQAVGDCRVLSVCAKPAVSVGEVFSGEARYSGRVRFDCLVVSDGKIGCVSAIAEFSDKMTAPDIAGGMDPVIVPEIVNTEATVADGTLRMTAVVNTAAYAVTHCDFSCMAAADDGIYTETRELTYSTAVAKPSETAYLSDSITDVKAADVLFASGCAVLTGAECAEDEVKLSGAVYTNIVAATDDGLITSYDLVTPFVKSLAAPGVTAADIAVPQADVTDCSAALETDGEEKNVQLAITLRLEAAVVSMHRQQAAVDVFCPDNAIEVTETDARLFCAEPTSTVFDTVDGQISLEKDRLAADSVLAVSSTFATVSDARVENGRLFADGLVGGDIVYYNAEKNAVDAIAFRMPFSMPLNLATAASSADVSACVTDVKIKVRRESVFDIKADVAFTVKPSSGETVRVVESVRIGEPVPRPDATMIIHIARPGETLWQAAKALCCSPERVAELNDTAAPYAGGERLINFCGKR